ncbi:MAG: YihY/virulence factor BrkB family protein, partial [Bacilli bacterium]
MKSWIDFGKTLAMRMDRDDMSSYAAALAYKFLFSLFPLILFLTALLGFLHLPTNMNQFLAPISTLLPPSVMVLLKDTMKQVIQHENPTILSIGIIVFVWEMSGAFMGLMDAFNHAYQVPYPYHRSVWWRFALALITGLLISIVFIVALLIGLGGYMITQWFLQFAFHWQVTALVSSVIRWVLLLALLIVSLDILYTILPDVDLRFIFFRPGTMVATTSFMLMSGGFSLYISHFNNYNKMYGSLGTVILLLLYLYLFALA